MGGICFKTKDTGKGHKLGYDPINDRDRDNQGVEMKRNKKQNKAKNEDVNAYVKVDRKLTENERDERRRKAAEAAENRGGSTKAHGFSQEGKERLDKMKKDQIHEEKNIGKMNDQYKKMGF